MEIGIDSFAASPKNLNSTSAENAKAMAELLERMECADQAGLDSFGIGEHYRKEFLDSAPTMILAAAAARTKNIRLSSAVTVLSASDPVRVFQQFATLDLISEGRAEIVAGRGSFTDAFPLFGLDLQHYDELFEEKLDLLLKIRESEAISWSGRFRPAMHQQSVYPRPVQEKLPIWLGVGGTQASFVRAGVLGLPLMLASIGGQTHRFAPLVNLYRRAGEQAGHAPEDLKVGLHSLGYLAETTDAAISTYYPGYEEVFNNISKERGFPPVTREGFDAQNAVPQGALLVGSPEDVAEKIKHHDEALGGISRITFQMDVGIPHEKLMQSIQLMGSTLAPLLRPKKISPFST